MRHVYSIARYVPDTGSGERVNLAVLAGSPATGEWAMRVARDGSRARMLGGSDRTVEAVMDYLRRMAEDPVRRVDDPRSEDWLYDLADRQLGVVQFSRPLPMDAESAEAALDVLWPSLIVEGAAV